MRKLLILMAAALILCGCGGKEEPDTINGFEEAVFEKFNSPAEENGLGGTLIYVEGDVLTKATEEEVLAFTVEQDDGNCWVVCVTDRPEEDGELVDSVIGAHVRVFGEYAGYSDTYKMPVLAMNMSGGKITVKNEGSGYQKVWDFDGYEGNIAENPEGGSDGDAGEGASEAVEPVSEVVDDSVPTEYRSALIKAERYSEMMNMSKIGIYDQLTSEYGEKFSAEAAQYAIDNMQADWNANALAKAENYGNAMNMSKAGIYDQLVSEYGERFTAEEAQYAIDNVQIDWNANALEKAKSYQETMSMSPEAIRDQLVSEYGEKFTPEEADYAIQNLN